ncbi:MAG: PH domain-containing protein [Flavobacterium sp.]
METNFSQPQRQSSIGVLVMFFDTIRHWARGLWPFLVIWIFKFNELNKTYFFLGAIIIFIIIGVVAYLKYLNFTFFLDYENEEFIINEGVFNKTKTTVQLHKIQQVNINQSLIQRIIGVYSLDVDTAGSAKKEGEIKAISHALALELKTRLLHNERKRGISTLENESAETPIAETHPFIQISFLSLLKVGITSNYVKSLGLILAFFATMYENVNNFAEHAKFDKSEIDHYIDRNIDKSLAVQSALLVVFLLFCSILVINLFRVIVRYFDYKISRQSGSLLLSFGLLNTKSTIIKPEKVQITTVSRNYFQKKMNILELKIKQATSGEKEERKSVIEIPGCNEFERDEILKLLFRKIPEKGIMLKPNFRKLVFSIFLTIVLPLIGFFLVGNHFPELLEFAYLAPFYALFLGLIHYFGFRNYRLFIHEDFIIKQSGAWDISNEIIEPMKIQALTTSQLFWHKSADIGYLTIHTAGGNVAFQLGDFTTIKQYVNLWLYEIETSDSNWM